MKAVHVWQDKTYSFMAKKSDIIYCQSGKLWLFDSDSRYICLAFHQDLHSAHHRTLPG
jgi:hypothetical protein